MVKKTGILLFGVCMVAVAVCSQCVIRQPAEQQNTICIQNNLRIYFTPGPDCEKHIIAEINKAPQIDIAVYSITNPAIVDAIIDTHNRGTKIRIITDRVQSKGSGLWWHSYPQPEFRLSPT